MKLDLVPSRQSPGLPLDRFRAHRGTGRGSIASLEIEVPVELPTADC